CGDFGIASRPKTVHDPLRPPPPFFKLLFWFACCLLFFACAYYYIFFCQVASVQWNGVAMWGLGGVVRSPNLAPLILEVTNKTDWKSGNSINFIIVTQSGHRT